MQKLARWGQRQVETGDHLQVGTPKHSRHHVEVREAQLKAGHWQLDLRQQVRQLVRQQVRQQVRRAKQKHQQYLVHAHGHLVLGPCHRPCLMLPGPAKLVTVADICSSSLLRQ